jgi:hypothetical protein
MGVAQSATVRHGNNVRGVSRTRESIRSMSGAVPQSFGEEKYEKPNLDTAAVLEDQAGWTGIVN